MMAIILVLAYAGIFLVLWNIAATDWRQTALRAAIVFAGYLVLLTNVLSLVKGITPWGLLGGWCLPVIGAAFWLWRIRKNKGKILLPRFSRPANWLDGVLVLGIIVYLLVTVLVAWMAPPNTYDSLTYHMSRVAHWAQNQSVEHFATGIEIQNTQAPGAEWVVLNFYVLAGGDRLVNLVEWLASVGCVIGAAYIAAKMGAGTVGQRLASVFVVTLPMGIAQASSTMTDYVVAFWMICLAAELVQFSEEREARALLYLGAAAGLAFLTKATAAAYLLPFALWTLVIAWRRLKLVKALQWGGVVLFIIALLNFSPLLRNQATYGQIFDAQMSTAHGNELLTWQGVTSNLVRHAALQVGTPWLKVNHWLEFQILRLHVKLGLDMDDPRTTSVGHFHVIPMNYSEVLIGNPFQAILIVLSILLAFLLVKRLKPIVLFYGMAVIFTFVVFAAMFKWQVFSSRYHLPFFVLFAPFVAVALSRLWKSSLAYLAAVALLIVCVPFLFHIEQRPLLSTESEITPEGGNTLLNTSREQWLFATAGFQDGYLRDRDIADAILQAGCHNVAVMLSGNGAEYPYWSLLGKPAAGIRIEWIVSGPSDRYRDLSYQPCAVICQGCESQDKFNGLPKVINAGIQLFLDEGSGGQK